MAREDKRPLKQYKCQMCWEWFSSTSPNSKLCPACRRPRKKK